MAADWCGQPLPDDRDGWKTRAMAFRESALAAEAERDKAQMLAASLSEELHRVGKEIQRYSQRSRDEDTARIRLNHDRD